MGRLLINLTFGGGKKNRLSPTKSKVWRIGWTPRPGVRGHSADACEIEYLRTAFRKLSDNQYNIIYRRFCFAFHDDKRIFCFMRIF